MFIEGRLRRIDVNTDRVATSDGFRVGAKMSDVKRRYGARLRDEPHGHDGPESRYLTKQVNRRVALRFITNATTVNAIWLGYNDEIQLVEGCS